MSGGFTGRLSAVVTDITGAGGQIMAESGGYPGVTIVTTVTFESGLNVFEVFTGSDVVVMATAAIADHFTMVGGEGRCPFGVGMTGLTRVG